ncbi:MAG: formate dehydrogenase accessory sulfurtransferase FdhD, partial [Polyangiaceae bacterium]|nr:formate dehydrogenase accessory sulfurtransferase FdhD [Polyangiaceae bacterium]
PLEGEGHDLIVREEPLFLDIGGTRLLTMRTPMGEEMDKAWALGFLASEGVIADRSEVQDMAFTPSAKQEATSGQGADEVRVRLWRSGAPERIGLLARTHEMRASCGLCGVQTADMLVRDLPKLAPGAPKLAVGEIARLVDKLRVNQPLFAATGGCHGTAIASPSGELLALAEDIGRHNALDRAIGLCLQRGVYLRDCIAVISGRAGYELVIKALRVGLPMMLSVGAASGFGIELARAAGVTLVGFIREANGRTRHNVYADAGRLVEP